MDDPVDDPVDGANFGAAFDPAFVVVAAGIAAALHVGKLPVALPVLRDALGIGVVEAGFLLSLVQAAGMTAGLAVGLAADAIGLKRCMAIGLAVLGVAGLGGAVATGADGIGWLLVSRAAEGVGLLLTALPAPALIRRLRAGRSADAALGLWGAYMPLGVASALLAGPWVIGIAGWRGWWVAVAVAGLVVAAWFVVAVPSDRRPRDRRKVQPAAAMSRAGRTRSGSPAAAAAVKAGLVVEQTLAGSARSGSPTSSATVTAGPVAEQALAGPAPASLASVTDGPVPEQATAGRAHTGSPASSTTVSAGPAAGEVAAVRSRTGSPAAEPTVPGLSSGQAGVDAGHPIRRPGRLARTLASPGPWLLAVSFALYSGQWLAVIGFLPTIYAEAGIAATTGGLLTALAAAANGGGNVVAGRLLQRGAAPALLLRLGFAAMALGAVLAFWPIAGVGPSMRYAAVVVFSGLGGLIPGTLFSLSLRLAPGADTLSATVGWMQQLAALGQFGGPPLVALVAVSSGGWQWSWAVTGACAAAGLMLAGRIAARLAAPGSAQDGAAA